MGEHPVYCTCADCAKERTDRYNKRNQRTAPIPVVRSWVARHSIIAVMIIILLVIICYYAYQLSMGYTIYLPQLIPNND
jgi:uncharacterized membrane protein YvbJ